MSDVSRETAPPALAAEVFADRLSLATAYAQNLATAGVQRGLIGPREVPRLWDRHILNSAVVAQRVPPGASVADIGSGAGLPGLVWAIARPDITVTLIEPSLRRTNFLEEVCETLGLDSQVRIVRARAESIDETFDVVTARAVAPLEKLGRWCLPLVHVGGVMLALKGSRAQQELDGARRSLIRLGGKDMLVTTYGDLDTPTTVVEVSK